MSRHSFAAPRWVHEDELPVVRHPEDVGAGNHAKRETSKGKNGKSEAALALERLALKGSCIKDGGEVHAMLLVAMRPEQRQLLPAGLSHTQNARLFAFVRRLTVLQGSSFCGSPRLWCGTTERAMLKFQADRQLALATVTHRGLALQHVPSELRDDKEVVLTAVRKKARALEFATPRLQADCEVVLQALRAPGGHKAIPFISEQLMFDQRIQVAARYAEVVKLKDAPVPLPIDEGDVEDARSEAVLPVQRHPILSQEMLCLLHL